MSDLRKLLVTGLGTGYLPLAPGTWGSLAVCGIFVLAAHLSGGCAAWVGAVLGAVALLASIACVSLGRFAEEAFGQVDPRQCTIDEWAGQAVTFCLLPTGPDPMRQWLVAGVGFAAFRLFDIVKPPPVRQIQKLPAGWGILVDDLLAGVYANAACQLIFRLWLRG